MQPFKDIKKVNGETFSLIFSAIITLTAIIEFVISITDVKNNGWYLLDYVTLFL